MAPMTASSRSASSKTIKGGLAAPEFCERLLKETGVMVFPGTMFGDTSTDYIRISYLQPLERIKVAMARIAAFAQSARATA